MTKRVNLILKQLLVLVSRQYIVEFYRLSIIRANVSPSRSDIPLASLMYICVFCNNDSDECTSLKLKSFVFFIELQV